MYVCVNNDCLSMCVCPNIPKDDVFCSNINRMLPQQDMMYKKQANKTEHYQEGITNKQHCHLLVKNS